MASAVPRLLRHEISKRWARDPAGWSPYELLSGESSFFLEASSLTVKRSRSRFFMYEEHGDERVKLQDKTDSEVLQRSPSQLVDALHGKNQCHYHYWTSPVADVAPGLLKRLEGYEALHGDCDRHRSLLDPRGPSLWMGSSGSATQAHYDVADNVIVQLFGTKRVRCYPPNAARALHVFPDAHPRARKSQVNLDAPPDHARFPHFSSLASPVLDVVLAPGDVLHIPAFWFHHVENGRIPGLSPRLLHQQQQHDDTNVDSYPQHATDPARNNTMLIVDGPSVSLNMFALSVPMLVAQRIFREASRPFGNVAVAAPPGGGGHESLDNNMAADRHNQFAVEALRALGWALLKGLHVQESPEVFIRTFLLDTRYAPLGHDLVAKLNSSTNEDCCEREGRQQRRKLTALEQENVEVCIARILTEFESLRSSKEQNIVEDDGIAVLVVCHLLELWAVELVGAPQVANAWEAALLLDAQ